MNQIQQEPTAATETPSLSSLPSVKSLPLLSTLAVDVERLVPSPTNPRKDFSGGALGELAESIRTHGILQPLLVRELKGRAGYEIVCGERRWRAAKLAGLTDVPVICRRLTDHQVVEMQVVENLQRADLNAMEEAQGYEVLIQQHGMKPEDLAARIGKSRSHIYCRLKLMNLCPRGRQALLGGKIKAEVALLIARMPDPKLQEKALREVIEDRITGEPMSYREAARWLKNRDFTLVLSAAPWPLKDAGLVPAAGPCTTCPKNSRNQKEVFPDARADVCTDPACFAVKRQAWTEKTLAAAAQQGQGVLTPDAAKKIFSEYGGLHSSAGYVDLNDRCDLLGYQHDKHWQQTLGKKCPQPILAVDPNGAVHKLLKREEARAALVARLKPQKDEASGSDYGAEVRARTKLKQQMRETALRAAPLLIEKLGPALVDPHHRAHRQLWELLARSAHDQSDIERDAFIARRRELAEKQTEARAALNKFFKESLASDVARGYVLEALLVARWNGNFYRPVFRAEFKELCELAGVDLKSLNRRQQSKRR
jgi:ParB/RepB/Spo0J family partition protein